jgi:hypothetical protein
MMGEPTEATSLRERLRERRAEVQAAAARRGASNTGIFGSVASTPRPGDDDVLADAVELESA